MSSQESVRLLIFFAIAIAVVLLIKNMRNPAPVPDKASQASGERAPAESNYTYVNRVRGLKRGQPQLVEMFGTHCGPCKQMVPHMAGLTKKYPDVFIMSCSSDPIEQIETFVNENPQAKLVNIARDHGDVSGLMQRLGQTGIPHAFLFDATGKMVWHGHPAQAEPYVRQQAANADRWASAGKGRRL